MGYSLIGNLTLGLIAVFGLGYPSYESFKALETPGGTDDTQWLTYWIVFAFFTFIENFIFFILEWVPLYLQLKLVVIIWLVMPMFQGAKLIYQKIVRPWFIQNKGKLDGFEVQASELKLTPEAAAQLQSFTQKYGQQALSLAVQAASAQGGAPATNGKVY